MLHKFIKTLTEELYLEYFSDTSFANLTDCGSQGEFILYLADAEGRKSRRISRVVKPTLAAETMALLEAAESAYYIGKVLDIGHVEAVPIICCVDNRSLVEALRSVKKVDDKYLRINIACLKDMLERRDIAAVKWIDT